jgi:hypothetical protein
MVRPTFGDKGEIMELFGLMQPEYLAKVMIKIGMPRELWPNNVYVESWPYVLEFASAHGRLSLLHETLYDIVADNFIRQ